MQETHKDSNVWFYERPSVINLSPSFPIILYLRLKIERSLFDFKNSPINSHPLLPSLFLYRDLSESMFSSIIDSLQDKAWKRTLNPYMDILFEISLSDTSDLVFIRSGAKIFMPSSPKGFFLNSKSTRFSLFFNILTIPLTECIPKYVSEKIALRLKQYLSQYYLNHSKLWVWNYNLRS